MKKLCGNILVSFKIFRKNRGSDEKRKATLPLGLGATRPRMKDGRPRAKDRRPREKVAGSLPADLSLAMKKEKRPCRWDWERQGRG